VNARLDKAAVEKLLVRARIAADRMGLKRDREELAQEVLCRMLEGKNQHSTVDQTLIDALRERSGRKGSPNYEARLRLYSAESREPHHLGIPGGDRVGADLDDRIDIQRMADFLRGEERALMKLRHQWGMNEVEIADLFGVSASRICQRLKGVCGRLSARASKAAHREREFEARLEEMGDRKGQSLPRSSDQEVAKKESSEMESNIGPRFSWRLT
jgi:DNA-directed RNA polymerase specialized sigma24 family protein